MLARKIKSNIHTKAEVCGYGKYMKNIVKRLSASMLLLMLLIPVVASAQTGPPQSSGWDQGYEYAYQSGVPDGSITNIIKQTLNWLLAILGFFGIIGFVVSGILYLTAAGNDDQISTAKNAMKYSIIGVIVALLGFVIIKAVDTLLTGTSSNF